jgi:hypothetical protein
MAMAMMMFTSCLQGGSGGGLDDDGDGKESLLIGSWILISEEGWEIYNGKKDTWDRDYSDDEVYFTFMKNGKMSYEEYGDVLSWEYSKGTLTIYGDDDYYEDEVYDVLTLTSSRLVMELQLSDLYEKSTYRKKK